MNSMPLTLHWQYGRRDVQALGRRNAIELQFRQKERYWAAEFNLNYLPLSGIGSRADEAMNSGHIANAFTLCVILWTTVQPLT
jgi:hypothetical protein